MNTTTETQTREEIIKGLAKPIAQPHVETFAECFPAAEAWSCNKKTTIAPRWLTGQNIAGNLFNNVKHVMRGTDKPTRYPDETMRVGPYCRRRDGASMAVSCADWVLSRIREKTIIINNDVMSFEIVDHDNGYSLVLANHSQILGSVWLAYIRTDSIPNYANP